MRKILIICTVLVMASVALADDATCANGAGIVIEGKVSGHKYCKKSTGGGNWWNAYAWCDALGRRLIERRDCACGDITPNCLNNKCPEFDSIANVSWSWMADTPTASTAYTVALDIGSLATFTRNWTSYYSIICY